MDVATRELASNDRLSRSLSALPKDQQTCRIACSELHKMSSSQFSGIVRRCLFLCGLASGLFAAHSSTAWSQSLDDLVQACAGCHGDNGIPTDKTIPVIWGQTREYLLKELHDFKTGLRKNETMSSIASSLSMEDMEALATHFSELKWPNLGQPPATADTISLARAVTSASNCRGCHQEQFEGDYIRPRLAGQQQDYLLQTMNDFRDGHRANYSVMTAVVRGVDANDLKSVAAYLAGLQPALHSAD
jgi:cytochrome c553